MKLSVAPKNPVYNGCRYTQPETERMLGLAAAGIDPASDRYLLQRHPPEGIRQRIWKLRRKDPARWAAEMAARIGLPVPPWPEAEEAPGPASEPDPVQEPEVIQVTADPRPVCTIGPSADFIPADLRPRRSLIMAAMQKQWLTKIGKWPAS